MPLVFLRGGALLGERAGEFTMSAATAAAVAAVVPPVRPTAPATMLPAAVSYGRAPLPLPALAARRTSTVVYGLSSIDNRGRVVDLKIMRHLDWRPGLILTITILTITEAHGTLTITADTAGAFQVTPQGHVRIPAPLRHLCALTAGDRVLLAADPSRSRLKVYPPATLDLLLPGGETT